VVPPDCLYKEETHRGPSVKGGTTARQLSPRGGDIGCEVQSDRVILSGRVVIFLEGEISVADH
jgi:hypothetical protein